MGGYCRRTADFIGEDLSGSHCERVNQSGSRFERIYLSGAAFRAVEMSGVVMRGVDLFDVDIHGAIWNLKINGVDVGRLVNTELDRTYPERAKMRPADPAGFREAWDVVERVGAAPSNGPGAWTLSCCTSPSVASGHSSRRCGTWRLPPTRGSGESFSAIRHRGINSPFDEMPETPGVPRDRAVRPWLDVVLELRRDRMSTVREVIDGLTDESLDRETTPVEGPGWPESRSYRVRECLAIILNEEWEHGLYTERDLDALQARR